jgi:2-polyprenyl-6-methoxyphenol hydroxylase-like FAD-dependent oxidoreductase
MSSTRIGIIGAGIGGLATANALVRRGFSHVKVLERATKGRHGVLSGYGFGLSPNGLAVLDRIGLYDQALPLFNNLTTMLSTPSTGEAHAYAEDISFLSHRFGYGLAGTSRGRLLELLETALPAGTVQFGRDAVHIGLTADGRRAVVRTVATEGSHAGPAASVSDLGARAALLRSTTGMPAPEAASGRAGSTHAAGRPAGSPAAGEQGQEEEEFDVLVAADGIHSPTRQTVTGAHAPPVFSSTNIFFGATSRPLGPAFWANPLLRAGTLIQEYGRGLASVAYGLDPEPATGVPQRYMWAVCYASPTPATRAEAWDAGSAQAALQLLVGTQPQWQASDCVMQLLAAHSGDVSRAAASGAAGAAAQPSRSAPDSPLYAAGVPSCPVTGAAPGRGTSPGSAAREVSGADSLARPAGQPAVTHFGLFYRPPQSPWTRGPIVLLGDAAHATLPHLGQGANMALDDAYCLAQQLASTLLTPSRRGAQPDPADVTAAVTAYERRRLAKTAHVVRLSKLIGDYQIRPSSPVGVWLRDALLMRAVRSGALLNGLARELMKDPIIQLGPQRVGPDPLPSYA